MLKKFLCIILALGTGCLVGCSSVPDTPDTPDIPDIPEEIATPAEPEVPLTAPAYYLSFDDEGDTEIPEIGSGTAKLFNVERVKGYHGGGVLLRSTQKNGVELGKNAFAQIANGKSAVTLTMWVLGREHIRLGRLFSAYAGGSALSFGIEYRDNKLTVGVRGSSKDSYNSGTYEYSVGQSYIAPFNMDYTNEGMWQHIAVVVDYANKRTVTYVNGKQVGAKQCNFAEDTYKAGMVSLPDCIGWDANEKQFGFNGKIDEFCIFDTALTPAEIAYRASIKGDTTAPVDDEALVRSLAEAIGTGFVFKAGDSVVLTDGMMENVDADYSNCTFVKKNALYVPQYFADKYKIEGKTVTQDGKTYVKTEAVEFEGLWLLDTTLTSEQAARASRFFDEMLRPDGNYELSRSQVVYVDPSSEMYSYSPSIIKVGDTLYVSYDIKGNLYVEKSEDNGKSWDFVNKINGMYWTTIFEHNGAIYALGVKSFGGERYTAITRSTDGGKTFAEPVKIPYEVAGAHCAPTPVLKANGKLYKGYEIDVYNVDNRRAYLIYADENADLMDPDSWGHTTYVNFKNEDFTANGNPVVSPANGVLEGNAVLGRDGKIYNIIRLNSMPHSGYAVVLELNGNKLSYGKNAVIEFDGGITKFSVKYDEKTDTYISFVNTVTNDYRCVQRNVLSMAVSKDMWNWETVETILVDRTIMNEDVAMSRHGFQYVDWITDGDDILIAVREASGNSYNFHESNCITVYRIEDYASLIK